jgi:predicted ABC-type ATPase
MPVLSVIAGPNGSGKSTLTAMLEAEDVDFGQYLNADNIAREFGEVTEFVSRKAQQIVRDMRKAALAEGRDHSFETVMSHTSHIEYMAEAKRHGFDVRLFFVATDDPVINLDRVANRVLKGGHSVPDDRVIARYERCLENLPAAISVADSARIYDNSSADRPMRLLASKLSPDYISVGEYYRIFGEGLDDVATQMANIANGVLVHADGIPQQTLSQIDPATIPVWWMAALLQIKPDMPFVDGPL